MQTVFEASHACNCSSGKVSEGDSLISIQKLEPHHAGGYTYSVTDRAIQVHASTVRLVKVEAEPKEQSAAASQLVGVVEQVAGVYKVGDTLHLDRAALRLLAQR